jgi:hypothetical protein
VFSVQGKVGSVRVRNRDWRTAFEVNNAEGSLLFLAQRFNRISGGFEFQVITPNYLNCN